ncbi:MAG: hypothetical protein MI892_30530 [Desulfobacterales bacterium]|nr:hypothetical protein [Desulfobacterales bacterium]
MEPISANISLAYINFQTKTQIRPPANVDQNKKGLFTALPLPQVSDSALLGRLPLLPAQGITDVFRSITALAIQAAEIGQTYENRNALQNNVSDDLEDLKTILEDLTQDDLRLFIAVFENQIPDFSSGANSSGDDGIFDGFTLSNATGDILNSLFQIDLTTEKGIFSALDLANNILDTLSIFNTGSDFLESFLEDLNDFGLSAALAESLIVPEVEETDTYRTVAQSEEFPEESFPLVPPGSNPPTIIELAG